MKRQCVWTVVFAAERALRAAVDPEYEQWETTEEEPFRREIREHKRRRSEEQKRLHGREHKIPKAVRRAVYQRDGGACVRCGAEVGWEEWRCHHEVPYPVGLESLENLATLCADCHDWLHYGFLDQVKARPRLEEFRQWWEGRAGP